MEYIKRSIEMIVRESAKTFKAVLVTGSRQTGKSTLLKKFNPENILKKGMRVVKILEIFGRLYTGEVIRNFRIKMLIGQYILQVM